MPQGLHFGLENRAAHDDAMNCLSLPFQESAPRRPFGITRNGDLLELVHVLSEARGRSSITGSWVLGHATDEDIQKGLSDDFLRAHKEQIDYFATKRKGFRRPRQHWVPPPPLER